MIEFPICMESLTPTPPATLSVPVDILVDSVVAVRDKSVIVADPELNVPATVSFPPTLRFFNIPIPPAIVIAPVNEFVDSVVFVYCNCDDGSILNGDPFNKKVPLLLVVRIVCFV